MVGEDDNPEGGPSLTQESCHSTISWPARKIASRTGGCDSGKISDSSTHVTVVIELLVERDNGNVHRAAANSIVSKSRAARGSVCNVLLSDVVTL